MAINVQPRGSKHQLRVTHKLLPKPFFATFDTEDGARDYGQQIEVLLARGIVPAELLAAPAVSGDDPVVSALIGEYLRLAPVTDSDEELLGVIRAEVGVVRVSGITMAWAETYVAGFKTPKKHLAPGTIRKRVGSLARVLDWHFGRTRAGAVNILRLLPPGYSLYTKEQAATLEQAKKAAKVDVHRDRRFQPGEEDRVRAALAGVKREGRERALKVDPAFTLLFRLIADTGVRLSEAFKLRVRQVDIPRKLLHVDGSKGHRGALKPRTVPLKREVRELLAAWCEGKPPEELVFPFWNGTEEHERRAGNNLSARFAALFAYAGVEDFTEHDLRHEATCRWVTLRDGRGWMFSDVELCRLMGWQNTNMLLRYASLRGEDLSDRLGDL